MTWHLSDEQIVSKFDGESLSASAEQHLAACGHCQQSLEALRALQNEVRASGDVPEPSPLYWEHLSARVRRETSELVSDARPWWEAHRWALLAAACGLLVAALSLPALRGPHSGVSMTSSAAEQTLAPDESDSDRWADVVQVAAQLSVADVSAAVPSMETATLVDDLTPQERAVLARLLVAEMERIQ